MTRSRRELPQAAPDADAAMALVCTIPAGDRAARRHTVHETISQATAARELENGVAFQFAGTDEIARELLDLVLAERSCCADFRYAIAFEPRHGAVEFRVEGAGALVRPLKEMYLTFTPNTATHA
jgi:hypothetical protein